MRTALLASILLAVISTAGCGGGGGSTTPGGGTGAGQSSDQTLSVGGLVTRISGTTQQPISVAGAGATVSGVAGGTVSSLTLTNPTPTNASSDQILAQTHILVNRNGQLYLRDFSGGAAQAITDFPAGNISGKEAWFPDGSRIVFSNFDYTSNHYQLYTMNPDGSGVTRISNGTADDGNPSISANGQKLVFQRTEPQSGLTQIYSMLLSGGVATRLSDNSTNDSFPAVSPGADKVAFIRPVGGLPQLFVMNGDGSGPHLLSGTFTSQAMATPAWSPDGTKIVCTLGTTSGAELLVIRADGRDYSVLTSSTEAVYQPCWSPDSTKVAYVKSTGASALGQIWVINQDGNYPHSISDGTNYELNPAWSPYIRFRRFVGSGTLATTAAGFMAGQQGKIVTSLVLFNATTPDTAFLSAPASTTPGQSTIAITVTADLLTSLLFTNSFTSAPTVVLNSTVTATGAVVTFDANDGTVSTVLPFNSKKAAPLKATTERVGNELILRRSFTGVWDRKGKNLSPGGASEVHVNARTGTLISFR